MKTVQSQSEEREIHLQRCQLRGPDSLASLPWHRLLSASLCRLQAGPPSLVELLVLTDLLVWAPSAFPSTVICEALPCPRESHQLPAPPVLHDSGSAVMLLPQDDPQSLPVRGHWTGGQRLDGASSGTSHLGVGDFSSFSKLQTDCSAGHRASLWSLSMKGPGFKHAMSRHQQTWWWSHWTRQGRLCDRRCFLARRGGAQKPKLSFPFPGTKRQTRTLGESPATERVPTLHGNIGIEPQLFTATLEEDG